MNTTTESNSTELVPVPQTETSLAPVEKVEDLYAQFAGLGNENVSNADKQTMFLQILQATSPQCQVGNPKFNKNARPGNIINTVTGQLFDGLETGIYGIPCFFNTEVIEWAPRDAAQKGLRGRHKITDPIFVNAKRNEKKILVADNGNELRETHYHGFLQYNPSTGEMVKTVVPFSSTELKKSKNWNTQIDAQSIPGKPGVPMPRFGQIYKLTAVGESNSQGNWLGWKIELASLVKDANLLKAAHAYYQELTKSGIKTVPNEEHSDSEGTGNTTPVDPAKDQVPF